MEITSLSFFFHPCAFYDSALEICFQLCAFHSACPFVVDTVSKQPAISVFGLESTSLYTHISLKSHDNPSSYEYISSL